MANRFTFPPKFGMRVQNNGNLLAYFTFVDEKLGLEFRDWKLLKTKDGERYFVSSPAAEWENKKVIDPKTKKPKREFTPYVREARDGDEWNETGKAYMAELTEAAVSEFERLNGEGSGKSSNRSSGASSGASKSRSTGSKRSGTSIGGPMDYEQMFDRNPGPSVGSVDEDDDLPF
jgi:hypothetical protein